MNTKQGRQAIDERYRHMTQHHVNQAKPAHVDKSGMFPMFIQLVLTNGMLPKFGRSFIDGSGALSISPKSLLAIVLGSVCIEFVNPET